MNDAPQATPSPAPAQTLVVVGGVAGGMSAAARYRRLNESAEIIVFERDEYVSFANCGLPYHIGGDITDRAALLLQTPVSLRRSLNLDVRTGHEVISIDRAAKAVTVRRRDTGEEFSQPYDALVLATGGTPVRPPLPGIDHPRVLSLRNIPDMDRVKALVDAAEGTTAQAVVIGAGYVGLETAEAFVQRGMQVTIVEMADHIMPTMDPEMAAGVEAHLREKGVTLHTSTGARAFRDVDGRVAVDLGAAGEVMADVVIMSVGVRPETSLHRAAGLELSPRGAVVVDAHQRTNDPSIYAVGDSVAVTETVTGEQTVIALAGPANRQGRIAADAIAGRAGRSARYTTSQGTSIVKVFELTAAGTGPTERTLSRLGVPFEKVYLWPGNHAGYYPGATTMHLKVLFDPTTGRVLGAQAVGREGVDKRIDVLAVAIRAGLTVEDLEELELAYAPPFGSAKDAINMAGFQAGNVLRGDIRLWQASDFASLPEDAFILDARSAGEYRRWHIPGSVLIPHVELRERLDEVPRDRPVYVLCRSGFRSYLAYRVLAANGYDARTLSGGELTFRLVHPGVGA